jgi:putative copper resistance protein D
MKIINSIILYCFLLFIAVTSVYAMTQSSWLDNDTANYNSSVWIILIILTRLLIYLTLAISISGLAALLALTPKRSRKIPYINHLPMGCLLGLIAASVNFFLQVGAFAGVGISGLWDPEYIGIIWDSWIGKSYRFQLIGWGGVLLMMIIIGSKLTYYRLVVGLGMIGIIIITASFTFTPHLAETPLWIRFALMMHIIAAMWWIGSLYPLRCACEALRASQLQPLMIEYCKQAMFIGTLLIISGIAVFYILIGSFSDLLGTNHGNLLLFKLGTAAVVLFITARHKLHYVPNLKNRKSAQALKQSITKEMWIGFLILIMTAIMSTVTASGIALK